MKAFGSFFSSKKHCYYILKIYKYLFYRSLVQTNDHLLKELDETRQRHHHEVKQLNWSYEQLKKTFSGEPSTIPKDTSAFVTLYDSDT